MTGSMPAASGAPLLQARGLTVVRAGRPVVDGIDVAATSGEFVGVVGPNGAGKSTLLAALAGLLAPDGGAIDFAGRPLAQVPADVLSGERAYLPQHPRCDWPLAVERVVALGLPPGIDAASRDAAVAVQLDALGLGALRGRAVTTLSGGELCRVMLGRALVGRPGVLIVDEPLAGLDPRHAQGVVALLRGLARSQGCLVIAALHDLSVVGRHCTRLWALRDGRLLADRPAAALDAALVAQLFDVQATVAADGRVDFG